MTVRYTVFEFVFNGSPEKVFYPQDYVHDYQLTAGCPVYVSRNGPTFEFDALPHRGKSGKPCQIMCIESLVINLTIEGGEKKRCDTNVLYLAAETESTAVH